MFYKAIVGGVLASAMLLTAGVVQASVLTYNLIDAYGDGSGTANPTGPWSLNAGASPMTEHFWLDSENAYVWDYSAKTTNPSFAFETVNKWNDCKPGDIVIQGNPLLPANVTWTCPANGVISISGLTWDAYGGRGGARWALDIDDAIISEGFSAISSRRSDGGVTFAENLLVGQTLQNITIHAGDIVRFSDYGNTNGLVMSIAFTVVPEPSTLVLLAIGALGLLAWAWRRR